MMFAAGSGPLFETVTAKVPLLPVSPFEDDGVIVNRGVGAERTGGVLVRGAVVAGVGSVVPTGVATPAVFVMGPVWPLSTVPVIVKVATAPFVRSTVVEIAFPLPLAAAQAASIA